jgi:hypothetical protein
VLAQVATAISSAEGDITHLAMDPEPVDGNAELRVLVSVRDRLHLAEILRALRRVPCVLRVSRHRAVAGATHPAAAGPSAGASTSAFSSLSPSEL